MAFGMGICNAAVFKISWPQAVPQAVGGAAGWCGWTGAFGGFGHPPVMAFAVRNLASPAMQSVSSRSSSSRCFRFGWLDSQTRARGDLAASFPRASQRGIGPAGACASEPLRSIADDRSDAPPQTGGDHPRRDLAAGAEQVRTLSPAYFAMVMATGIVAIAAHLTGMFLVGRVLAVISLIAYVVLVAMTLTRIALFPRAVFEDLIDHQVGVGFFTLVAGTAVLGSQNVILFGMYRLGAGLWIVSCAMLFVIVYAVFAAFTVKQEKPTLAEGIHSGWLVAVVATQAVATLGAQIMQAFPGQIDKIAFVSRSALWSSGGMLYIWMISLVFYRYTFFPLQPRDLKAHYWINMGAMAVSALGGAMLLRFLRRRGPCRDRSTSRRVSHCFTGRRQTGGFRCW